MAVLDTRDFGTISFDPEAAFEFPRGLPGFEDQRQFLPLHFEATDPLIFLQSLQNPKLCFLTLPVLVADPQYRLAVMPEDLELIGLPGSRQPRMGAEALCLSVVSLRESGATANLLAPIVVNLANRRAVQAVAAEPGYPHQHPLMAEEVPVCS